MPSPVGSPRVIPTYHSGDTTMRKIKLSIEHLRVESFAIPATERGEGTIFGNAKTLDATCYPCPSAIDACPSVFAATLPCNGCVDTELCVL